MTVREISGRAGLHYDAVHKLLRGDVDPRASTVGKFEAALVAEEIALRDHLLALHPVAPPFREAAE
mgnify:CR=1 FL=1